MTTDLEPDTPAPVPATIPPPRPSFFNLVGQLAAGDEALGDPAFDPAALIGDIRGKVDDLHFVIQRMAGVEQWLKALAEPLTSKARAIKANRERLRAYVVEAMRTHGFMAMPGGSHRLEIRESPPALTMTRPATAADFTKWPAYVVMVRSYEWDAAKVKAALLEGGLDHDIPAKLTVGHWPDFKPNVPAAVAGQKKKPKEAPCIPS